MNQAYQQIVKSIDFRLNNIIDAHNAIEETDRTGESRFDAVIKLRTEVAFFIHLLKSNFLTREIFQELLDYDKILKTSSEFQNAIALASKFLKELTDLISGHERYPVLLEIDYGEWSDPFFKFVTIPTNKLISKINKIAVSDVLSNFKILDQINTQLNKLILKWSEDDEEADLSKIVEIFNQFRQIIPGIEYQTGFLKEYSGANAAVRLNHVCNAINPTYISGNLNEIYFSEYISQGVEDKNDSLLYTTDCKKIRNHIILKIDEGLSIESSIKNFINYMEYYRNASDYNNEKDLQKEFELHLFNDGYFPVSEAQLKNARIDTLAVSDNNAFLIEYKQIGWSSNERINLGSELNKIKQSFVQTDIYIKRLEKHPHLMKAVYILIFSKKYFMFENGITHVEKDNITFYFKLVYLGLESPSEIKNVKCFDVKSILKQA